MAKRRPSGDGMVRKRSDGRWEGRIVIGHKENGDPIFRYVSAGSQRELMNKLRRDMEGYRDVELTEDSQMTLSEWLDRWLAEYIDASIRPSTINGYRGYIKNYIKPRLGHKKMSKITTDDVQRMYRELLEEDRVTEHPKHGRRLAPTTLRRIHGVLHEAMDVAVREGLIPRNPTEGVALPKKRPPTMKILNNRQLERFMEEIKKDAVWHDFFYTELTTGLRRGELLALQWDDLDMETGVLKISRQIYPVKGKLIINDPKTKAAVRTIILPPSTAQLLAQRKKSTYSQWIFHDPLRPERPVSPHSAYSRLKTLLKGAGLPNIRFHDLRHTFATMALEHGMDVKTLSAIIGHVSSSTTLNIYAHVTDEMRQSAAAKIDRGIAKAEVAGAPTESRKEEIPTTFTAQKPPRRRPGQAASPNCATICGRALLPHLARRQKARPQHLRQNENRMRGKTESTHPRNESRDCPGKGKGRSRKNVMLRIPSPVLQTLSPR